MLKNVGSNWTLNFVQILVFMVLTRFVVDTLGKPVFGVWETIVSFIGPLQLLILGVPMASVRYVAEHVSAGDTEKANKALSTCLAITLAMGIVAALVGIGLYFGFDAKYIGGGHWTDLGAGVPDDARIAFAVMIATVAGGFVMRLPYGVYDAHHDFIARNLIMATGFLLKLTLTVSLLSIRASLAFLAIVQIAVLAVEFIVATVVSRRRHGGVRLSLGSFDRSLLKDVLSFSIFAMLLNMGALLAFRLDAIVIGWFRASEEVAVYGIGNKVFEPFINVLLAIGMVVMPLATALKRKGEEGELRDIFLKWSKIAMSIVLMLGFYLLILGPQFLEWWIGDEYVDECGRLLQILMISFLFFLPMRGVALPILMGLGRPGKPAIGLLVMGIANLALSVLLIRQHGLTGVALGTAIPNVLFAAYVLTVTCRELDVGLGEFLSYVLGRALPGLVLPVALLLALKHWAHVEGFWPLFLSGLGYVGLFGLCWVFFVFRGDRHLDLHAKVMEKVAARRGDE
ncbi:MAG: oligosaccharide flippase family protein [bacterium]|nr:oligosaccharide flippase family protein [bacterium]